VLSFVGLVLIFVLFLLLGPARASRWPRQSARRDRVAGQRYILQMVGFSILTGVLVGVSLGLVGVKFAFAFGFIAFLLNFIPTVGPLAATLLPLPVVLLDDHMSPVAKILALALPAAVQLTFAWCSHESRAAGRICTRSRRWRRCVLRSIWGSWGGASGAGGGRHQDHPRAIHTGHAPADRRPLRAVAGEPDLLRR